MKKVISLLLVFCLISSLTACGGNASPQQAPTNEPVTESSEPAQYYSYFWSATNASSGYYAFNVTLADLINEKIPNVEITVLESGGAADNLKNLENGQAFFAQCAEPDLYEAQHGIGSYKDKEFKKSRLLFLACPLAYYFTVSKDSGVTSLSGLSGKDYSPGLSGSTTELISYELIENILGYKPKWYPASTGEAVASMKDRRIIGFTKSGATNSPDSSLQDVATTVPIKILSFSAEEKEKVLKEYPYYRFTTVDGSLYNQEEDIESVGMFFCAMVSSDVPEDVVYNVVKTVMDNQDYIATGFSGVKGVDMLELTANSSVSYMHPGLIKYLKEKGYTVKDEQIPPEMK